MRRRFVRHPRRYAGDRPVGLRNNDQFSTTVGILPGNEHGLAAPGMKRIVNPPLDRVLVGSMSLLRRAAGISVSLFNASTSANALPAAFGHDSLAIEPSCHLIRFSPPTLIEHGTMARGVANFLEMYSAQANGWRQPSGTRDHCARDQYYRRSGRYARLAEPKPYIHTRKGRRDCFTGQYGSEGTPLREGRHARFRSAKRELGCRRSARRSVSPRFL